jgi:hypothetical protein
VRIYKKDIQGICDSTSLNTIDSLLQLFKTPVLWSNRSQATAKIIKVDIGKKSVNGFHLEGKSFLIQQVDSLDADKYNQLTGKTIDGLISEDTIRRVIVKGNADVLYYAKNKNKLVAQNKTSSSEIYLWFKNSEAERVTFKPATEGNIDPIKDIDIENAKLKGFSWLYYNRPKSRFELHLKKEKKLKETKNQKPKN